MQRIEAFRILNALAGLSVGWVHHPVTKMWRGSELHLALYGLTVCQEWTNRGYEDNTAIQIESVASLFGPESFVPPKWLGDSEFHLRHQSNLLRKNPNHYKQYFPNVPDNLEYIYPTD